MRKLSIYRFHYVLRGAGARFQHAPTVSSGALVFLLLAAALLFAACSKLKPPPASTLNGNQVANAPLSSIRLFNFYNAPLDVKVNNIELTAFSADPRASGNQIGLSIFPTNVWPQGDDGSPVTLPATLLDKNQQMHIIIRPRAQTLFPGLGSLPLFNVDTVLTNSPLQPYDFYATTDGRLMPIPRNSVSPSVPSNFKFRILNFGNTDDTLGLAGSVVLTYADGTPVSQLNPVSPGVTSPYIELPYGSYQFKLYIAKPGGKPDYTKQLAELPIQPDMTNFPGTTVQQLVTQVRGYSPGGTYSIVVTPNIIGYDLCGCGSHDYFLINSYRVITEQAAPLNTSWARIQGVNALSASGISLTVDGQAMGSNLSFGQNSDYTVVPQGTHTVEAIDASGKVLASGSYLLYPFDNITAWAYTRNGQAAIAFSNTDLSSTIYEAASPNVVNDGTNGATNSLHLPYVLQMRFMNLSDVPYVTFMNNGELINPYDNLNSQVQADTLAYPQAYINLAIGQAVTMNPFVLYIPIQEPPFVGAGPGVITGRAGEMELPVISTYNPPPAPVEVFQSEPANPPYAAQVPGVPLLNVPSLTIADFASGTQIYTKGVQQIEDGFFTVALIGSTAAAPGSPLAARMIALKHNK